MGDDGLSLIARTPRSATPPMAEHAAARASDALTRAGSPRLSMHNVTMRTWLSTRRSRWFTVVGAGMVASAIVAIALSVAPGSPHGPDAGVAPNAPRIAAITATGLAPSWVPSVRALFGPGDAILTSAVNSLDVYDGPGGVPKTSLGLYTRYATTLTLMAIDYQVLDGTTWYQVSLPAKPNGQTGWVRASDVTVASTDTVIHVYLADHQLDVVVDGTVTFTAPVAVGSPATPTPLGTFYITDPIDLAADPTSAYGSFALGLSAYSEALETFKGTLPQIAIHGTNRPESIGQSVSNGCIRMNNDAVRELSTRVGLGTPVIVSASRASS